MNISNQSLALVLPGTGKDQVQMMVLQPKRCRITVSQALVEINMGDAVTILGDDGFSKLWLQLGHRQRAGKQEQCDQVVANTILQGC